MDGELLQLQMDIDMDVDMISCIPRPPKSPPLALLLLPRHLDLVSVLPLFNLVFGIPRHHPHQHRHRHH